MAFMQLCPRPGIAGHSLSGNRCSGPTVIQGSVKTPPGRGTVSFLCTSCESSLQKKQFFNMFLYFSRFSDLVRIIWDVSGGSLEVLRSNCCQHFEKQLNGPESVWEGPGGS